MSQPSKHLLEAFKASSSTPPSAPRAPAAAPSKPAATTSTPSLFASGPAPRGWVIQPPQAMLLGIVAVLAVVCAFLLGRASVRGVAAASTDTATNAASVAPQTPPTNEAINAPAAAAPQVEADRQARSPAEQALLNPANVYTIKLLEYSRSETNQARALETLRYLTDVVQFPACVTSTSSRIVILVGAAPKQSELDALLSRAKTIAGPPPLSRPAEFHDAYIDKIDKLFPRKP